MAFKVYRGLRESEEMGRAWLFEKFCISKSAET